MSEDIQQYDGESAREATDSKRSAPVWIQPAVDYGPLAVFFIAYLGWDLIVATGALMAATAVALAVSYAVARKIPVLPLVTAGIVGVFGGLTLWLQDETFIKMKPTIVQLLFAAVLLGGLATGRPLLKKVLGHAFEMTDEGWRKLSLRYAVFFIVMAGVNEVVWRTTSTDFWVTFKVFGILGITVLFVVSQVPMMQRYMVAEDGDSAS